MTGYSIGTHNVEEHISTFVQTKHNNGMGGDNEDTNAQNSISGVSEPTGSLGLEGSTDLYIYAIDAQEGLVKTDEMIR